MGFDINVEMILHMCPEKGKPYFYRWNEETKIIEKVYGLPELVVPEKFRNYLVGRGHHFHAYTADFNEEQRYTVSAGEFLDKYPRWKDVKTDPSYEEGWLKQDHRGFKSLLKWCCNQDVPFRVSWSY